jgi:hypothetical protein
MCKVRRIFRQSSQSRIVVTGLCAAASFASLKSLFDSSPLIGNHPVFLAMIAMVDVRTSRCTEPEFRRAYFEPELAI